MEKEKQQEKQKKIKRERLKERGTELKERES